MGRVLTLDEMLEIVTELNPDKGSQFQSALELIGTTMAELIGQTLKIRHTDATFEGTAFAGTCSSFSPRTKRQPLPEALEFYDQGGDWEYEGIAAT